METKDPIELLFDLCERLAEHRCNDEYVQILLGVKDEIEAQYMRIPVDADGVPIRPGDIMRFRDDSPVRVDSIGNSRCYEGDYGWFGGNGGFYGKGTLSECRHVKPDPVAEELAKFLTACGDDDPHYYDEQIAEFAERIRKAVEHG